MGAVVGDTEAHRVHKVVAVQELVALLDVDTNGRILVRRIPVHVVGYVVVHAAYGVHDVRRRLDVYYRPAVHLVAQDVLHGVQKGADAVAAVVDAGGVGLVHLLGADGDVYEQVTGQVHKVQLALDCIEHTYDVCIRVQALAVQAADQESPHAGTALAVRLFRSFTLDSADGVVAAAVVGVVGIRPVVLYRSGLGPDLESRKSADRQYEYDAQEHQHSAAAVLAASHLLTRDVVVRGEVDVVLIVVAVAAVDRVVRALYVPPPAARRLMSRARLGLIILVFVLVLVVVIVLVFLVAFILLRFLL